MCKLVKEIDSYEEVCAYMVGREDAIDSFLDKIGKLLLGVHPDEMLDKVYRRDIYDKIEEIAIYMKENSDD